MSDPPTTPLPPPPPILHHQQPLLHHHHHHSAAAVPIPREYRKGNWTLQETLILITAKRLDDERRLRLSATATTTTTTEPSSSARTSGELRWKWVENYCWSHGCLRSQNQCNDKWDNLLRDYKKVRDYESKSESSSNTDFPSYWTLDKHQRKERNLPSNMIFDVYKAISEVLHRKHSHRTTTTTTQDVVIPVSALPLPVELITSPLSQPNPVTIVTPPPPPPPPLPQPPEAAPVPATGVSEKSESSSTEYSQEIEEDEEEEEEVEEEVQVRDESEAKPRKVRNLGSSLMRSASVIARALRSCEEKKAKRHRQMMELEQRRLKIEEDRVEVNRQGIASLVSAVTNLSGAIQSLISDQRHHR